MNLRLLASGLVVSLAVAGCATTSVVGDYNFAEHPGKGLVVLSTRMTAGDPCPHLIVTGGLGFWQAHDGASVDAVILAPHKEDRPDSVVFPMQVARPERKVPTFSDMGGEEEITVAADPPTLFVVQDLPAGHYILNSLRGSVRGGVTASFKAKDIDPHSFTVNEGEVVYLGEIGVSMRGGDCKFLDPGISGGFAFSVRDEWARDGMQFKAAVHNISPAAVQKRLLQLESRHTPAAAP